MIKAPLSPPFRRALVTSLGTLALVSPGISSHAAEHPGLAVYKKMCEECHGNHGQGVDGKYDEPLVGEKSIAALARYIEKSMPEDKEGTCVGDDAKNVAAYMYDAFYSPAAQDRLHPPLKDLSRLTIPQFRASVMDLMGHFANRSGKERVINFNVGLKATYRGTEVPKPGEPVVDTTAKKGIKRKVSNKTIDRVEPVIAFHWGADSPEKGVLETDQFNNRWEGSFFAQETGLYEFSIKTENGARLWVNDDNDARALIDAWVSSGPEVREEKKSIFLLGGRAYFLRLDHFKFKEKSASIELWWKPPHGTKELMPKRVLSPDRTGERLVVSTNFPADDRSSGYERGTTISKAWDQAVTDAALSIADAVALRIDRLAGTKVGAPDRADKLKVFAADFVATAFRRPLSEEQRKLFVDAQFAKAKSPDQAIKRVVLLTLESPEFLYPNLPAQGKPDDFDVSARLALALWDSLPDKELLDAATQGKLRTRDQVQAQARRMIADPRTKAKAAGFFHHWLDFERAEAIAKDPKAFPDFNDEMIADLRESLLAFIDQVVWSPKSDYRELLQADYLLLNERLGKFYGKPVQGDEFQRVSFDPKQRAGVVTHPYLLASLAYSKQSSPVHRGVFLTRNIVGMSLKPPVKAVVFEDSHFNPKFTMREKITEMTRNDACMHCHRMINPLGFSLENFDAVGRWRTKDNNKPVNPVSELSTDDGKSVKLTGPRDIVNFVADNPSGHRSFIRHLFNHLVKQQIPAYGPKALDDLQKSFAANGCNIQKLIIDIATVAASDGLSTESKAAQ